MAVEYHSRIAHVKRRNLSNDLHSDASATQTGVIRVGISLPGDVEGSHRPISHDSRISCGLTGGFSDGL